MYRNSKRITPLLSLLVVGGFTVTYYLQLQAQQTAFQKQKDRFFTARMKLFRIFSNTSLFTKRICWALKGFLSLRMP
jgi:hypothetical protein